MNELGAARFDHYEDADGAALRGAAIGTWDEVTAASASFVSAAARRGVLARAGRRARGCIAAASWSARAWPGRASATRCRPALARVVRLRAVERRDGRHDLGPAHLPVLSAPARPLALSVPAARASPTWPPPCARPATRSSCSTAPSSTATRPCAAALAARADGGRHLRHGDDARRLRCGFAAHAARPLRACWSPAARCRPASPRRSSATSTSSCAARASRRWSRSLAACEAGADLGAVPGVVCRRRRARRARGGAAAPSTGRGRAGAATTPARRSRDGPRRASPFRPATCCPTSGTSSSAGGAYGYSHHDGDEHPRLPVRLRVLQQRRVRPTPTASARRATCSTRSSRPWPWATTASRSPTTSSRCDARRVHGICDEIARRGLRFSWECLGRVDTLRRRDRAAHEGGRLLSHLLRHRVGQRRDPAR